MLRGLWERRRVRRHLRNERRALAVAQETPATGRGHHQVDDVQLAMHMERRRIARLSHAGGAS